jgi:tRNA modification GTPase
MQAPRSYTREDVAEIHSLSSPPVLAALSERIIGMGGRLAGPGEFTRRAFQNGRIDLSQAEAVIGIIEAEDDRDLRLAQRKLEGGLSRRIRSIRGPLVDLIATVEAGIDFAEQGIEIIADEGVIREIRRLRDEIVTALGPEEPASEGIRESLVEVCLAGLTNVGKSSLFNRLVGEQAARVTAEEGTTRDYLRATIEDGGVRFRLTDPAGIRGTEDPIEKEAVRRARDLLETTDIAVVVLDGSREGSVAEEEILEMVRDRPHLLVINKADLPQVARSRPGEAIVTSAATGEGIPRLREGIRRIARGEAHPGAEYLLAARERGLLARCRDSLIAGEERIGEGSADCAASDLKDAADALGEVSGEVTSEEILDRIFSRFCIGK